MEFLVSLLLGAFFFHFYFLVTFSSILSCRGQNGILASNMKCSVLTFYLISGGRSVGKASV